MYAIPILVLIVIAAIAVAWSPVFALIIAVPLFLAFLAYAGLRPRADEKLGSPTGTADKYEDDTRRGMWGEPRS